jgi:hypothetical protein
MEEMFQLALVVAFAAVLLITGQFFMEYRSTKIFNGPAIAVATRGAKNPWGPFPSSATLSLPRRSGLDTN